MVGAENYVIYLMHSPVGYSTKFKNNLNKYNENSSG